MSGLIAPSRAYDVAVIENMATRRGIGTGIAGLQSFIEAELEAIEAVAGPPRGLTEVVMPDERGSVIRTMRRIATLTSISERRRLDDPGVAVALVDGTDFRQLDDFRILRLGGYSWWGEWTLVEYDPVVDQMLRYRVATDLLKLSLDFRTASRESIGPLEIFDDYHERRRRLLDQLTDGRVLAL